MLLGGANLAHLVGYRVKWIYFYGHCKYPWVAFITLQNNYKICENGQFYIIFVFRQLINRIFLHF